MFMVPLARNTLFPGSLLVSFFCGPALHQRSLPPGGLLGSLRLTSPVPHSICLSYFSIMIKYHEGHLQNEGLFGIIGPEG